MNRKNSFFSIVYDMRKYLLLWATQAFSSLGSGMTSFAIVIWVYEQSGSALSTAGMMVASYTPYILCSVFAGALSDRWNKKKIMLWCDVLSALTTVITMMLMTSGRLQLWHLYALNAAGGLMNTVQQPASEVATTALLPREHFHRVGGLRYLSGALNGILRPILAMAVLGLWGIRAVFIFDLLTFAAAFVVLLAFIDIPQSPPAQEKKDSLWRSSMEGLAWLRRNPAVLHMMLFLAAINLVASMYEAAFPAMMLSREGGGEEAMGLVNAVIGAATLLGSIIASVAKAPRSRVRVVCNTLLLSMATENIILALGRSVPVWCAGGFLGWIAIPLMNANLDVLMRTNIPVEIQGRVFSARNSLQFFTIPVGYFLGGYLVDRAFEPLMASQGANSLLIRLFGQGGGSGAACFFGFIWLIGLSIPLLFRFDRQIWKMEQEE
ncbi:MAG: MFS transporter [Clostridia bacterium]|nr:MFS transporter [Clostridia bacterium]